MNQTTPTRSRETKDELNQLLKPMINEAEQAIKDCGLKVAECSADCAPPNYRRLFLRETERREILQAQIQHQGDQLEELARRMGDMRDQGEHSHEMRRELQRERWLAMAPLKEALNLPDFSDDQSAITAAMRNLHALHQAVTVAITDAQAALEATHFQSEKEPLIRMLDTIRKIVPQYFTPEPTNETDKNTNG